MLNRRAAAMGLLTTMPLIGCASTPLSDLPERREVGPYRLTAGDRIRIGVFGEPSLSGDLQIGASGVAALPLIGDLPASGLTPAEFQTHVTTALRQGYLTDPRVTVELLTPRPFYILGEVRRPGQYPHTEGLSAINAVAMAEGFSYRADMRRIHILSAGAATEETYALTPAVRIAPGDTLRIGERFF